MVQMEVLDRLASRIGLYPAVLLMKVRAWTRTNERKGQQKKDGRYWTYNSISAWHELIPYMSEKQIRTSMKYLRDNGYLLAEKAKKHQWNQTLHYALSDLAIEIFKKLETHSESVSTDTAHLSDESAPQDASFCLGCEIDLPFRANDTNALSNPFPCNEMISPPPLLESSSYSGVISHEAFRERLGNWNITESKMRDFMQRTGRPEYWAYQWLGIMAEDIRLGHVEEYRSPIGALMKRHKENWPFPHSVTSAALPETRELQAAVENSRRKLQEEYESIQLDPASPFWRIHTDHIKHLAT